MAALVCITACSVAVLLIHRAQATKGSIRLRWALTAGTATGFGIWATHFIAMLAFDPGHAAGYDLGLTLLSLFCAMAVTAGYSLGAILLSVGASIARELIGSNNALVNGAALAVFAAVSGIVALAAKPLPARVNIVAGGFASTAGMGLLMLAANDHSLAIFLLALTMAGAAYSFSVLGGLSLINAHAPPHQRGETISAIYLIGYLLMGLIAFSIGLIATAHGLERALDFGAPVVASLSVIAAVLAIVGRGRASELAAQPQAS